MNLNQGDKLGNYQIIRILGEGGMGTVWLASDLLLEREVAIKCLNPLLTQDQEFSQRFLREARIQGKLGHANIVGLHACFEQNGQYFMVLEHAPGITLRDLINKTGPIPEQRALVIFRQILSALGHAHAKGIVHRDIKPSNIMIDEQQGDTVKVMDFGIARLMGDVNITRTGTRLGTISYMSPEQVRAEKDIDQRSDVYSAGVILYEMLSGRLPFDAHTDSEYSIQHKIVTEPVPDPRKVYPYISDTTVSLLNKMTQKDRDMRPQNAGEIDLSNYNSTFLVPSPGTISPKPFISGPDKKPKPALPAPAKRKNREGLYVLMIIIIVLVAVLSYHRCNTAQEDEVVADTTEVVTEETVNPIDDWTGKVKTLVEEWEAKAAAGAKMTQADLDAFVAAKTPLMEAMQTMDLTAVTEEQTTIITDLNARMDKLINETIPGMMK